MGAKKRFAELVGRAEATNNSIRIMVMAGTPKDGDELVYQDLPGDAARDDLDAQLDSVSVYLASTDAAARGERAARKRRLEESLEYHVRAAEDIGRNLGRLDAEDEADIRSSLAAPEEFPSIDMAGEPSSLARAFAAAREEIRKAEPNDPPMTGNPFTGLRSTLPSPEFTSVDEPYPPNPWVGTRP